VLFLVVFFSYQDTNEWMWVDNWPVWITNWGEGQPITNPSKRCVLNKDSVFGSEWITEDCQASYPYVCKTSTGELFQCLSVL